MDWLRIYCDAIKSIPEPSPPRNVTARSVNSTAIRVTWVEALNPNGKINYKLYVRLSGESEEENRLVYERNDTMYIVAGLEEFVNYTFTVASFNIRNKWTSKPIVAVESTRASGKYLFCLRTLVDFKHTIQYAVADPDLDLTGEGRGGAVLCMCVHLLTFLLSAFIFFNSK